MKESLFRDSRYQSASLRKSSSKQSKGNYYISLFCKPLQFLQYEQPQENSIILNLEKKVNSVICQYGPNNEKTSRIVVSFVQKLKDKAEEFWKSNRKEALAYFAKALSFYLPSDKNNHVKMMAIKVTIVLKLFHELHPEPTAEQLVRYVVGLLDSSEHRPAFRKNMDLSEEMVYFLMGFLLYKQGQYEQSFKYYSQAREVIEAKYESIVRNKKNQEGEDRLLQAQEKDYARLLVKVLANSAKAKMKQGEREPAFQCLDSAIKFLHERQALESFQFYYLRKKKSQVQAYFQLKARFREVPVMSFKSYIDNELPHVIEQSRMNNQNLYRFSFSKSLTESDFRSP